MVYLHEIAVPKFKALTGSLGYISLGIGVVIGILVTVLMVAVTSAGEQLGNCSTRCISSPVEQ
jgi:hypothetical protein